MDSGLFLFYYSIAMQICTILAAATSYASYLVSRNKVQLYSFIGFLIYYADCMLVFRDDYLTVYKTAQATEGFYIGDPVFSIVFGCGFLTAFWFVVCEYIPPRSKYLRWTPSVIFTITSILVAALMPQSYLHMFVFYSLREVFVIWALIYAAVRYAAFEDAALRMRLRHFKYFYLALWLLVLAVVAENVVFLLIVNPSISDTALPFFPERNFAENLFALACAFMVFRSATKYLAVHHSNPPIQGGESVDNYIEQNLLSYGATRGLSPREIEILRLLLMGKDNQNIASELHLSPGTVKVHVHHMLQKTNTTNRKELIQDYWNYA